MLKVNKSHKTMHWGKEWHNDDVGIVFYIEMYHHAKKLVKLFTWIVMASGNFYCGGSMTGFNSIC